MTAQSESERRKRAREAAIAAWLILQKRERRTAKALLHAEAKTLRALRITARTVVAGAVATIAAAGNDAEAAHHRIRSVAAALALALEREIVASRQRARMVSRAGLIKEMKVAHVVRSDAGKARASDASAAHAAGTSYATAWAQKARAEVVTFEEGGPYRSMAARVSEALGDTDYRLGRIAATETADAFNDERRRIYRDEPEAGMYIVWSAVLDAKTCARCFELDGRTAPARQGTIDGEVPPMHANCRCVLDHIIIPKPQRLEDAGIDYALFKEELRDVIREGRAISGRHATQFIGESQTDRTKFGKPVRSSVVLTEKYAAGKYARD